MAIKRYGSGSFPTTGPAERRADKIVRELGGIRSTIDTAIENEHRLRTPSSDNLMTAGNPRTAALSTTYHEQLLKDAEQQVEKRQQSLSEPSPLDDYLKKSQPVELCSPQLAANRQPLSPSQYNAPVPSSSCADAEALLKQVQANKAYLETNLDIIARATMQKELYSLVENLYQDKHASEKNRIRKEVDNRIASIQHEIQQELAVLKSAGSHSNLLHYGPTRQPVVGTNCGESSGNRPKTDRWRAGKKKTVQARINTGLKKVQNIDMREEMKRGEKENFPEKRPQTIRAKRAPAINHNEDEQYITRVYGKAVYQAQRSTLKTAPYLRHSMSYTPKTKPNRPVPVVQTKGVEVKSSKTQTAETFKPAHLPPADQYFFDPYRAVSSQQPPLSNATLHPIHGQLIPMAIPLGEPRVGAGLSQPVTITTSGPDHRSCTPQGSPRQKSTNVAVVNVVSEARPKLEVHNLPNVDIDTAPPTPSPSEDSVMKPPSLVSVELPIPPPQDFRMPTGSAEDSQFSNFIAVADNIEDSSSSEDELPVPGISLPGYRERPRVVYHGPPFPPKAPQVQQHGSLLSDTLAAGILRKDALENQAVEWIEQELMARIISELYGRQTPSTQPKEPRPPSPDASTWSTSSSQHSMVEAYGSAGLQLFVDAGQPVNQELVNGLVREVLEEKIAAMLGQHERESMTPRPIVVDSQPEPSSPIITPGSPVATPEVTPKATPVHTPPEANSPLVTPVASIAESFKVELEQDSLQDLVIVPEPLREAAPKALPVPTSPVTTPAATPPSTPPRALTPEISPRESPAPLILDETDLPTPLQTHESVTPEPEEEVEGIPCRSVAPEVLRTPTPVPPPPPSPPESSETESETSLDVTTTSVSETVGKEISEGEWLISKSEGQVDLIPDAIAAKKVQFENSSADSTMRGAEDIEQDIQETPSEGEIRPGRFGRINLTEDPVVTLLARLGEPLHSSPLTPHFKSLKTAATDDNGARSPGEVSLGQRPSLTPSAERIVLGQLETEVAERVFSNENKHSVRRKLSPGELGIQEKKDEENEHQQDSDTTLRISHLVKTNGQNSNATLSADRHTDSSNANKSSPERDMVKSPATVAPASPKPPLFPPTISVAEPRVIQVGSHRSPLSDEENDEEVEAGCRSTGALKKVPADLVEDERNKRRAMPAEGLFGMQTTSDKDTRTITPDAINIDALLQSGYLSQTFSQSEAETSDFERTRTHGQTGEFPTPSGATPFGATQTMTEDSLEFTKKMTPEKGPRTFSVTLPSAQSMQDVGDSSDGDVAQVDTISDVSEISAGEL